MKSTKLTKLAAAIARLHNVIDRGDVLHIAKIDSPTLAKKIHNQVRTVPVGRRIATATGSSDAKAAGYFAHFARLVVIGDELCLEPLTLVHTGSILVGNPLPLHLLNISSALLLNQLADSAGAPVELTDAAEAKRIARAQRVACEILIQAEKHRSTFTLRSSTQTRLLAQADVPDGTFNAFSIRSIGWDEQGLICRIHILTADGQDIAVLKRARIRVALGDNWVMDLAGELVNELGADPLCSHEDAETLHWAADRNITIPAGYRMKYSPLLSHSNPVSSMQSRV